MDLSTTKLIVRYIPQRMFDEPLEVLCSKYGRVKSCKIVHDRASGYSQGYGFVQFFKEESVLRCIEELNGHKIGSKTQ